MTPTITFTVTDSVDVMTISMADEKITQPGETLDKTGLEGTFPFALVGLLVIAALGGVSLTLWQLKRKRNTDGEYTGETIE